MISISEKDHILSKNALLLIAITSLAILIVGLILLALGYNEAFYVKDPAVQAVFEIITFTGEAVFFVVVVAIIYIAFDKKLAKDLTSSLLISVYVNEFLKDMFQDPRPSTNINPEEEYGLVETGYGFPSGHSQNAVATWGYLGYELKDKSVHYLFPLIFSGLIFLIALSRIILGYHDLQDIIGGLLFGIIVLLAFLYCKPILSEKIKPLSLNLKIILTIVISISLFLLGTLLFPTAGLGLIDDPPLFPDAGGFAQATGVILGFTVGYLLEEEYIHYDPKSLDTKNRLINLILGMLLVIGGYFALELLIHGNVFLRFIRYTIMGFILTLLLPYIFTKINK